MLTLFINYYKNIEYNRIIRPFKQVSVNRYRPICGQLDLPRIDHSYLRLTRNHPPRLLGHLHIHTRSVVSRSSTCRTLGHSDHQSGTTSRTPPSSGSRLNYEPRSVLP